MVADTVSQKLRNNNVFTVAKRNVEGQDMLYQSIKLTNGIWVLAELKIQPGNPNFTVCHTVFVCFEVSFYCNITYVAMIKLSLMYNVKFCHNVLSLRLCVHEVL